MEFEYQTDNLEDDNLESYLLNAVAVHATDSTASVCTDPSMAGRVHTGLGSKAGESHVVSSTSTTVTDCLNKTSNKSAQAKTVSFKENEPKPDVFPTLSTQAFQNGSFCQWRESGFTVITKSRQSLEHKLFAQGHSMVEKDLFLVTSIKVKFNVTQTITEFNVCEQFIQLLELFKNQDSKLRVQSCTSEPEEWIDFSQLPRDTEFSHNFQLITREF